MTNGTKRGSGTKAGGASPKSTQQHARRASVRQRTRKRSEQVALDIVQNIVSRDFAPGDKLPLESEMLAEYDVSRSSLREALRLLEVQGLITIRPGPGSGTEVGKVDPSNLSNTLALYLLMARSDLGQLLEAWRMVEPMLARLAATSADRERVATLMRPFSSSATTHEKALSAGLLFHDTVADLAENPVLSLILGAVGFLVTEQVRLGAPGFELSHKTVHDHGAIADLILAGDGEAAAKLMHEHLVEVTKEMEAIMPLARRGVLLQD